MSFVHNFPVSHCRPVEGGPSGLRRSAAVDEFRGCGESVIGLILRAIWRAAEEPLLSSVSLIDPSRVTVFRLALACAWGRAGAVDGAGPVYRSPKCGGCPVENGGPGEKERRKKVTDLDNKKKRNMYYAFCFFGICGDCARRGGRAASG